MFSESKAGPGYIVLNVIRVLNIIALLTVVVASWVMLVKTVQTSNVRQIPLPWCEIAADIFDSSSSLMESPISSLVPSGSFS